MNWKTFGGKLQKCGAYLSGFSGVGMMTSVPDSVQLKITSGLLILGFTATVVGHLIEIFTDEEPPIILPKIVPCLFPIALIFLAGCSAQSAARQQGTITMAQAYEDAYQNAADQFEGDDAAAIANNVKHNDLMLKHDLDNLAGAATLDAAHTKWTPTAIAAETTRLQALHDQKIADYKTARAQWRALKIKNEQVNLVTARALRDKLNPPPVQTTTVNLNPQIQTQAGTQPPATIIAP